MAKGARSESRCEARHCAIHVHYGIHLCEPFSGEICTKFTSTTDSYVCCHVGVNVNFLRISLEFN